MRLTQSALPIAERREVAKPISAPALLAMSMPDVSSAIDSEPLGAAFEVPSAVPVGGPPLYLKHCVFLI